MIGGSARAGKTQSLNLPNFNLRKKESYEYENYSNFELYFEWYIQTKQKNVEKNIFSSDNILFRNYIRIFFIYKL